MPPVDDLEYIIIEDFRPGIFSELAAGGGAGTAPDGAAQEDGTFGCVAGINGNLIPGPRLLQILNGGAIETNLAQTAFTPANQDFIHIGGISVMSGIRSTTDRKRAIDETDAIVMTFQYMYDSTGTDGPYDFRMKVRMLKNFHATLTSATMGTATVLASIVTPSNEQMFIPNSIVQMPTVRTAGATPALSNMVPVFVIGMEAIDAVDSSVFFDNAIIVPDPAADTTDSIASSTMLGGFLIVHQSRLVGIVLHSGTVQGMTSGGRNVYNDSSILYSLIYDAIQDQAEFLPDETTDAFSAGASVNANELFLVKERGGAISIRGALEQPTVIRYPGVSPTFGAGNFGTMTPLGFVYGSRFGVHNWNGGDTSTLISPQLEGFFWKPKFIPEGADPDDWDAVPTNRVTRYYGQFAYSEPFVFVPNNWLYDIRTKSWWRIPNIGNVGSIIGEFGFAYYATAPKSGAVYCATSAIPFADADASFTYCYKYSPVLGGHIYSWKSHPLRRTRHRLTNVRDIILVARGEGTISLTLTDIHGHEHHEEFNVAGTGQLEFFKSAGVDIKVQDMVVEILSISVGGSTELPAPSIDRIMIGVQKGIQL